LVRNQLRSASVKNEKVQVEVEDFPPGSVDEMENNDESVNRMLQTYRKAPDVLA